MIQSNENHKTQIIVNSEVFCLVCFVYILYAINWSNVIIFENFPKLFSLNQFVVIVLYHIKQNLSSTF